MRIFRSLSLAYSEIRRDLSRGQKVLSSRVQNLLVSSTTFELLDYTYLLLEPPKTREVLSILGEQFEPWLLAETEDRKRAFFGEVVSQKRQDDTQSLHPHLRKLPRDYSYAEILFNTSSAVVSALLQPGSRRCYLPIYYPQDLIDAALPIRIPCSLGYWLIIREDPVVKEPQLHISYLQRSCDLERFWASDVYFAFELAQWVVDALLQQGVKVTLGHLTHHVLSLHAFIDEEVY